MADVREMKAQAPAMLRAAVNDLSKPGIGVDHKSYLAVPDLLNAFARYKKLYLDQVLRESLAGEDVIIRTTAAGLLAEQKPTKENVDALKTAFDHAFVDDKVLNDAQLGSLAALYKLDKNGRVSGHF